MKVAFLFGLLGLALASICQVGGPTTGIIARPTSTAGPAIETPVAEKAEKRPEAFVQPKASTLLPDKFLFSIGAQAPVGQYTAPKGVAAAPDGTVYVADSENHRIQHFSASGSVLGTWGSLGSRDGQFWAPSSVAVGPDGTVYVADTKNNRIQHFGATGSFVGKWGSQGSGDGRFGSPSSVAVAHDGSVYVADTDNHRVQRFSASGGFLGKWGTQGVSDGQLNQPQGIAAAPDGTIYVSDSGNGRIQRFSSSGSFLRKWGTQGTGDGQFNAPTGISVDTGRVYVADTWNYRVQAFTLDGVLVSKWQFGYWLTGVSTDGQGRVYVADSGYHRVVVKTVDGSTISTWGGRGAANGEFWGPSDVAFSSDAVYVADGGNNRVQRFSPSGAFLSKWGVSGAGDGQFSNPGRVAVAPDGTVYVMDVGNNRVQHFSAAGAFMGKWGSQGSGDGQFTAGPYGAFSYGLAVAPDGTVYVADGGNHRLQRFSATGTFLGKWGSQGSGDGQFYAPSGVAVAPDGTVYVADTFNNRIQRFTSSGVFLSKWGSGGSSDGQFSRLLGVAVAPDGTVYTAEYDTHRIQRFSATGTFMGKWGSYGGDDGKLNAIIGVSVAPDGTVWVPDSSDCRIQVFGPDYLTTWRGEYFANRWLAEGPVLIQNYNTLSFQWYNDSPGTGVPAENFSDRFQRTAWFEARPYRFTLSTDDGARFWVDDRLLIEQWNDGQVATFEAEIALSQGYHRLRVEHYDSGGWASLALSWEALPVPTPPPVFLPLMERGQPLPGVPALYLITPPEANPAYLVNWSTATLADSYVLERATSPGFGDAIQVYTGTVTSYQAASEGIATYYYRVKGSISWGDSAWSNVQPVEVRWEREPNDQIAELNSLSQLMSGKEHYGAMSADRDVDPALNQGRDYFYFDVAASRTVELWLQHIPTGSNYDLYVRPDWDVAQILGQSDRSGNADEYVRLEKLPGGHRYFVQVYNRDRVRSTQPYALTPR